MTNFSIGLSALRTSQYALELVSNNVANANTEGYHRQQIHLEALLPNHPTGMRIGSGVTVNYIERVRSLVTETSLTNSISDTSQASQLVEIGHRIEEAFVRGEQSIAGEIDALFGDLTRLSSAPDEPSQLSSTMESAKRMAAVIRQASSELIALKNSLRFQLEQEVDSLNSDMGLLSEINLQISHFSSQELESNAELDQRDALLNKIAETIGVSRKEHYSGELNLTFGNASIQQTGTTSRFRVEMSDDGEIGVFLNKSDRAVDSQSGRIAALVETYNSRIPKYEERLNELASNLIQSFDAAHSVGIGTAGSFRHLEGHRAVEYYNVPLSQAGLDFPIEEGKLSITVTENGSQTTTAIDIDPDVDTLSDVASKITAISGVTASINTQTNQLQISTAPGVLFDFTGNVTTVPDLSAVTGTASPSFEGVYTGVENEDLRFEISGDGEVGITPDLTLNVYYASGELKEQINIGLGYEADSPIDLGDGITLSLSRGSVVNGDSFEYRFNAVPDETGILAALGLNSFFQGTDATNISISNELARNPKRLAIGRSGDAADTQNLLGMLELENERGLPGELTLSEYVNDITTEIGFEIQTDTALYTSLESIQIRIKQERDSISGVDLNEELVYLQQFQKSYEAAVRVIQATDQVLDELFSIIR